MTSGKTGVSHIKQNELTVRILSAAVLIPVVLGAVWFGGVAFALLILVVAFFMALEWAGLTNLPPQSLTLLGLATTGAVLSVSMGMEEVALVLLGAAIVSSLAPAFAAQRVWLIGGILYLGLSLISVLWMRSGLENGLHVMMLLLICVWATDIGGYFVGRTIGGKKLAPKISPGKTWSGFFGAVIASSASAALFGQIADVGSPVTLVVVGAVLACVAQMGDLLESAIKRHFGVKDSGALIPGHGGILDRVDGLITTAIALAAATWVAGMDVFQW